MATTMAPPSQVKDRPSQYTDTFASEWKKLTSVRSTYVSLGLGLVLALGMSALVALAVGSTFDEWTPAQQADFEPVTFSLVGVVPALIAYSVFGVLAISSEYSSGMIRLTFTATPRRGRVFFAKAGMVAIATLVLGLITTGLMFPIGQAVLASYDMPTASLGDSDVQRAVLGVGATMPFFPLIGLCFGALLRSSAGGITAVLGLIWLPEVFGPLLPRWWQENILSLLPGPALDSVVIGHIVESSMYRDAISGAIVAAAWLAGFLAVAYLSLSRRDA